MIFLHLTSAVFYFFQPRILIRKFKSSQEIYTFNNYYTYVTAKHFSVLQGLSFNVF
jgi:hypothetical protein